MRRIVRAGEREGTRGVGRVAASLRTARAAVAPRRKAFYAILAAGVVVFCAAAWPFVSAHLQAVAVLRQVAGQPVPEVVASDYRVSGDDAGLQFFG